MEHRLSCCAPFDRAIFLRAVGDTAVANEAGKARVTAVLCLTMLILAVTCLTAVYGALGTASRPQAAASTPAFTTFDAPGAGTGMLQGTGAIGINTSGEVVGTYTSSSNIAHGFVRSPAGAFATFDAPDAGASLTQGTFAIGINDGGDVTGMYADASSVYHGFVRKTGTITEFDVPAAPATTRHRGTIPMSINTGGDIAGFWVDTSAVRHGFVRLAGNGTPSFATFDVASAGATSTQGTVALSINATGEITGFYIDANRVFHGFLRAANGAITAPIDAPGASTSPTKKGFTFSGTLPVGISAAGVIAGMYTDANGVHHGFIRAANGTITAPIDAPGAGTTGVFSGTLVSGINAGGDITGVYEDANRVNHGFLRVASGGFVAPLDAPGASNSIIGMFPGGTVALGINDSGIITGGFFDSGGVGHGFVVAPAVHTPPKVSGCTATPGILWPPDGKPDAVTVSGTVTLGTQPIPADGATFAVVDEYGLDQPSGVFTIGTGGNFSFVVQLIARRDGDDFDGRTYTINITVTDTLGSSASCSSVVTVPHDQGN